MFVFTIGFSLSLCQSEVYVGYVVGICSVPPTGSMFHVSAKTVIHLVNAATQVEVDDRRPSDTRSDVNVDHPETRLLQNRQDI